MGGTIDIEALRAFLTDYAGTAAFSGFPAAMLDVMEIDSLSARELCCKAERMGIDVDDFAIAADGDGSEGFDGQSAYDEW